MAMDNIPCWCNNDDKLKEGRVSSTKRYHHDDIVLSFSYFNRNVTQANIRFF
jgi:hypothetical protein